MSSDKTSQEYTLNGLLGIEHKLDGVIRLAEKLERPEKTQIRNGTLQCKSAEIYDTICQKYMAFIHDYGMDTDSREITRPDITMEIEEVDENSLEALKIYKISQDMEHLLEKGEQLLQEFEKAGERQAYDQTNANINSIKETIDLKRNLS